MESKGENLGDAELNAIKILDSELQDHMLLTEKAFNLSGKAIACVPESILQQTSQSWRVLTALLIRLANDMRCAALIACRGYPAQAADLVASMYEVAYTIAYIGSDDSLAQKWIDHENPKKSFCGIEQLTKKYYEGFEDAKNKADLQYRIYRQLCMAKHSNPLFQMQHAFQRLQDGRIAAMIGPVLNISDSTIRSSLFALEHAAKLSLLGIAAYAQSHIPVNQRRDIKTKIEMLLKESNRLSQKAVEKFG